MSELTDLLKQSAARHNHLCPRQVLGVRMALAGLGALGLSRPVSKQSGLVIVETDGCFADGIEVASGATVGHRTLRVNDLGKIAAVFADPQTGCAVRLAPRPDARLRARLYAPGEERHYFAQLEAYQIMPDHELFSMQAVTLHPSVQDLVSKPGVRVLCHACGEEVINEREVLIGGQTYCRSCADGGYYIVQPGTAGIAKSAALSAEPTAKSTQSPHIQEQICAPTRQSHRHEPAQPARALK